ncbi:hypothetical protein ACMV5I_00595 [Serratia sp. T13T92]|jgi:hypothetical protein|uniref:hypothetical protein n=1 Tax=unclassified Serratia (in: enterobacteria) TaxID=2647522 RepID=UPI000EF50CB2|nr:hypothetical protein [Serratia sp. 3ACOL1]AYM90333.1 hypothetical protein D9980_06915 [Serratia sp. 3ACOL1]
MNKRLFAVFPAIILSGCAATWEPLGTPTLSLQEANSLCDTESLAQYPVKNEVATRSVEKQVSLKCNKDDDGCNSSGYKYENKLGVESYPLDVNINSRKAAFTACMAKQGWRNTSWL